jgi:acyl carrier protein
MPVESFLATAPIVKPESGRPPPDLDGPPTRQYALDLVSTLVSIGGSLLVQTLDLATQLHERLAMLLEVEPSSIDDDSRFADFGVDSMMRLELVALVEQHLGFEIPERDLEQMQTVNQVLTYVGRQA